MWQHFLQADPQPKCLTLQAHNLPLLPPCVAVSASSTLDPFHFILATHAKCVACFWAMPHDIPLPCSFRWLSRCPRHAKLF